jgi:hypothetical protein
MIKGLIEVPFSGLLVFVLAQFLLPLPVCFILGAVAAAVVLYITVVSENICFELEDDGTLRYFKKGALQNTFQLSEYRVGFYRRTEWGILGNNNIELKLLDAEGKETEIEAGPLGTSQFDKMFEEMEKYAIKNVEVLAAE